MKTIFTEPKICTSGKYWYAWYRYDGQQYRFTNDFNKLYPNPKEREKHFIALRLWLWDVLKSGGKPHLNELSAPDDGFSALNILDALQFAYEKKHSALAHKTRLDYACSIRLFAVIVPLAGMKNFLIKDVKKMHVKLILEKGVKAKKIKSNHSYNKHLRHFQALLSELCEWEIIENNPAFKIKKKDVGESTLHRPPTKKEFGLIINALKPFPEYSVYVMTIFHTLCREVEILRLRVGMIDLEQRIITLPKEITKSRKKGRTVLINDYLFPYLEAMNLQDYPKDFFVFGKYADNRMIKYVPAPLEIHRNRAGELWKEIVKDGLGIDVTLYANKAAGVDALLLAGAPIETVSGGCGHSEVDTTKIYASVLGQQQRKQLNTFARDYGDV